MRVSNLAKMKKYAFIDVQNTASTTQNLLGFIIDWQRLYEYLNEKWQCQNVFFYSGIEEGDVETMNTFECLKNHHCIVRSKLVFLYKKPDRRIFIKCDNCGNEWIKTIDMGYNRKSNCDVDLTVDAMEMAGPSSEFLIFTGDGDFEYLIRKIIGKGTRVYIISSNAGENQVGKKSKRFSKKLKDLINKNRGEVHFIDINSWRIKIEKTKTDRHEA